MRRSLRPARDSVARCPAPSPLVLARSPSRRPAGRGRRAGRRRAGPVARRRRRPARRHRRGRRGLRDRRRVGRDGPDRRAALRHGPARSRHRRLRRRTSPAATAPATGVIRGFSLTHFSGAGCTGFRDVPLIPTTAAVDVAPHEPGSSDLRPRYLARFDHRHERARPGDYRVTLDPGTRRAIRTEVTATSRVAVLRLRFPRTRAASVLVDAGGAARANGLARVRVDPARREVTGEAESGSFCFQPGRYRLFFAARFDRPLARSGTWTEQRLAAGLAGRGRPLRRHALQLVARPRPVRAPCRGTRAPRAQAGAYATFDARRARDRARSASRCPPSASAAARRTLAAEAPPRRSFAALRAAARARWAGLLDRVRVAGGRRADRVAHGDGAVPRAPAPERVVGPRRALPRHGRPRAPRPRLHEGHERLGLGRLPQPGPAHGAARAPARRRPRRLARGRRARVRVPAALAGGERPDERHGGRPRGADPRLARRPRRRAAHGPGGAARDGARRDGAVPHAHRRRHRARGPRRTTCASATCPTTTRST